MNRKAEITRGRRMQIVEYFLFAKKPIHEYDVIEHLRVSINTLLKDINYLRRRGFMIGSSRGYYELQNKITIKDIQKLTFVSDRLLDWMNNIKKKGISE